jgi:NAD(P)-dependent dehydrogenase (short-subunit alcohol dehydrogenase family)
LREAAGRVAVVTGGAAGIGLALARRLAAEGMRIVLADIRAEPLAAAARSLAERGAQVLAVPTDVAREADMAALLAATLDRFGAVHLVSNTAAVSTRTRRMQDASIAEWDWVLGVNVWGLLHAIRLFVPVMAAQDQPGHVVTFSSAAGLGLGNGLYGTTKHMIAALSEALWRDLRDAGTQIGVSVIFPGPVQTDFVANSVANAPDGVTVPAGAGPGTRGGDVLAHGMPPDALAAAILEAVRADRLYAVIPERYLELAEHRVAAFRAGAAPDPGELDALWRRLHAGEGAPVRDAEGRG